MSFPNLKVAIEGHVAVVSIDHPPANALNAQTFEGLKQMLDAFEYDPQVKVIVLTGEGRFFIAGADIKEFANFSGEQAEALSLAGQQLFNRMEAFSKPIIAAINGACLGGGLELAMSCHIRLAAAEAKLGLPELNLGLIPGYGGTQRLPRLVGRGKATLMTLTSEMVGGEEAQRIGLVQAVYPAAELLDEAKKLAGLIAEKSAVAMRYALDAINVSESMALEQGLKYEAKLFGEAFTTEDMKEGVSAFLEKRKPQFKDR
jgi:enoyl-CoA hydratase